MAQAESRNWSPPNKHIHKVMLVVIRDYLDFSKVKSATYNMSVVTAV
jgi:hypothetical protein